MKYILIIMFAIGIMECKTKEEKGLVGDNWAEKLGFPKGSKVVILHADDIGMCSEANQAAEPYLLNDEIQSAAAMVPCPWFDEFAEWAINNPQEDIGLHLTLTSEWQTYRWGPVSDPKSVPGLIDPDGFLWHEVVGVVNHATAEEVEIEIGGQRIDKHYREWNQLWTELTTPESKVDGFKYLTGGFSNTLVTGGLDAVGGTSQQSIMYPLQFWFCRNIGLALPLIKLRTLNLLQK